MNARDELKFERDGLHAELMTAIATQESMEKELAELADERDVARAERDAARADVERLSKIVTTTEAHAKSESAWLSDELVSAEAERDFARQDARDWRQMFGTLNNEHGSVLRSVEFRQRHLVTGMLIGSNVVWLLFAIF